MLSLIYSAIVLVIFAYFVLLPPFTPQPPQPDNSDDGGEPVIDDLPDLDLPPGITLPTSDWEPDYSRPRRPAPALG